jgi:adenylate cyclase
MSDIFISYSSHDREKAEQLRELLSSAGLSVWIDQAGIDVATSWSEEIVDAIDACKAFIVMLSPDSIASHNVAKEVSLASEKRKKILPLDLEPVELPKNLQYALAGIQRASMTNIDAIIRALGKLGLEATGVPQPPKIIKESDGRKTLMILPFEDLSPTGDNGWFADGIAAELIAALSNVKSLRVSDAQATKEFKGYKGQLAPYAHEMRIRYFILGSVRKFGDKIKITVSLLDIDSGDHVWQNTMKGTMDDIFDIQEKVAENVLDGLKIHLASDEVKKLAERGTENSEAYELYLKSEEYFERQTREGIKLSAQLNASAIALDPNFARAYLARANALTVLYCIFDPDPALLDEAEALCTEALRRKPDEFKAYQPLSAIYLYRGRDAEAEELAQEYVRKDPLNSFSYSNLGNTYINLGQHFKAIAPLEESLRLKSDSLVRLFNLVLSCDVAQQREKCIYWAQIALPQFERHLKLHPDAENILVQHAALLLMSGQVQPARAAAKHLTTLNDGAALFNAACLFGKLGDKREAVRTGLRATKAGYKNIRQLKDLLTDEDEGAGSLIGTPEYEALARAIDEIERDAAAKNNA